MNDNQAYVVTDGESYFCRRLAHGQRVEQTVEALALNYYPLMREEGVL